MKKDTGRKRVSGMNVGSASLVMVFSVLCLTIFAILSAVTARNEWNLAQKSAEAATAYYAADTRAAEILDAVCADYDGCFHLPEGVSGVLGSYKGQESLSYRIPVDARQELCVLVYAAPEGDIRVAHWALKATGSWTPADDMDVWDGNL